MRIGNVFRALHDNIQGIRKIEIKSKGQYERLIKRDSTVYVNDIYVRYTIEYKTLKIGK